MHMPRAGTDEMGNCATRLRPGLQCPENAVFFKSLGYDYSYVWGNSLSMDDEMETMCVFEAPENEALFQHARDPHEGLPASSLFVRAVLTVGNYDYTQTFKVKEDGEFEWYKELSGYAVGAYVLPGEESSKKMADLFGSMISESSYGALHTHSAVTKVDLDIAGTANSFKKKYAIPSDPATSTTSTFGSIQHFTLSLGMPQVPGSRQRPGAARVHRHRHHWHRHPVAHHVLLQNREDHQRGRLGQRWRHDVDPA